jgi:hypothetical protein
VPFFRTTSRLGVVSSARLSNHGVSSSQPEIARVHEAPESILQTEGFSTMSRGHACLIVPAIVIVLETGVGKNMTGRLNCRNRYTRQIEPRWMGAKRPTRQRREGGVWGFSPSSQASDGDPWKRDWGPRGPDSPGGFILKCPKRWTLRLQLAAISSLLPLSPLFRRAPARRRTPSRAYLHRPLDMNISQVMPWTDAAECR